VLGYPETATDSKIYNSAIVFNKEGEILHNYRKSFLYETDETWGASEGQGFKAFQLADGIKATIGICMDLNPYKFEAPFQKFEFSKFCRDNETNLIICPTAWLHSGSPSIAEGITSEEKKQLREKLQQDIAIEHNKEFVSDIDRGEITEYETVKDFEKLNEPDYGTLNYWILRFFPFVHQFWKPNTLPHKTTVILNNRSGIEDDVLYCGSSTILQFYGSDRPETFGFTSTYFENQNVKVLGALGKGNEGILVRNIEI
jgi:protein N-terminal amidase